MPITTFKTLVLISSASFGFSNFFQLQYNLWMNGWNLSSAAVFIIFLVLLFQKKQDNLIIPVRILLRVFLCGILAIAACLLLHLDNSIVFPLFLYLAMPNLYPPALFLMLCTSYPFSWYFSSDLQPLLQKITTILSSFLLHCFGTSNVVVENSLHIGKNILFITSACSGLETIWVFVIFSSILAYIWSYSAFSFFLLSLCGAFIASAINILRVAIIGFSISIVGFEQASNFVHDISGYVLFIPSYYIFFRIALIIQRNRFHGFGFMI